MPPSIQSLVIRLVLLALVLPALLLPAACAGGSLQAGQTPTVIVETVPVEVTRMVEVIQTVEVTREVMVTSIVEVPVTVTPAPTSAEEAAAEPTATPTTRPTYGPNAATATFPQEKTSGFAPLKIVNKTDTTYKLEITGPLELLVPGFREIELNGGRSVMPTVQEGSYRYAVRDEDGRVIFSGNFNITNPDKHELHIREDKVIFLVP